MGAWDYIKAVLVIALVVAASWYVTRLAARTGAGGLRGGKNMKLLETLPLGRDKSVALVQVGSRVYLLGVGPRQVERLGRIPPDELELPEKREPAMPDFTASFKEELNKRLSSLRGRQDDDRT